MKYLEWSKTFDEQLKEDGIKYYGWKVIKMETIVLKLK